MPRASATVVPPSQFISPLSEVFFSMSHGFESAARFFVRHPDCFVRCTRFSAGRHRALCPLSLCIVSAVTLHGKWCTVHLFSVKVHCVRCTGRCFRVTGHCAGCTAHLFRVTPHCVRCHSALKVVHDSIFSATRGIFFPTKHFPLPPRHFSLAARVIFFLHGPLLPLHRPFLPCHMPLKGVSHGFERGVTWLRKWCRMALKGVSHSFERGVASLCVRCTWR